MSTESLPQLDDYEVLGDVDSESPPTRKVQTAQEQAERIAAHVMAVVDEARPLTTEQVSKLAVLLRPAWEQVNQPRPTVVWRLRLFCGHRTDRSAAAKHLTVVAAFGRNLTCNECGLSPATILAGTVRQVDPPKELASRSRRR